MTDIRIQLKDDDHKRAKIAAADMGKNLGEYAVEAVIEHNKKNYPVQ